MSSAEYFSIIGALGGLVPAMISPIVGPIAAWLLNRSKLSEESAIIDYLSKRLEFLERVEKLRSRGPNDPITSALDREIEQCWSFLEHRRAVIPYGADAPQSRWTRFFLAQPVATKSIYKGLFYFFFGIAALYLLSMMVLLLYDSSADNAQLVVWALVFFLFYLGLALLARRAAR